MEIAVAEMAEGDDPRAWKCAADLGRGLVHESRKARNRDRDVMLERWAFEPLGLGDRLADAPQPLRRRLRRGEHRIRREPAFQRVAKRRRKQPVGFPTT